MGGVAGHMNHPHDQLNLTFKDMKEIIMRAVENRLDQERPLSEKVDGLQLQITYKDGEVKAARNRGNIITPLTKEQLLDKFKERGDLTDAFTLAVEDLETAFSDLPDEFLDDFFENGKRFINLEILYPPVRNVIPYGKRPYIQFHNVVEYNETGNPVGSSISAVVKLVEALEKGKSTEQSTFTIITSRPVKLSKLPDPQEVKNQFMAEINKLQREFNLQDSNTIQDYYVNWWDNYVTENYPDLSKEESIILKNRWGFNDKGIRLNARDFLDRDRYESIKVFDRASHKEKQKQLEDAFEIIFLKLGAEVLKLANGYLSEVPVKVFRREMLERIKEIRKELDNLEEVKRAHYEMQKIKELGGLAQAIPLEGIVFTFKGDLYKLTGLFAPLNKLLGFFRYSRIER